MIHTRLTIEEYHAACPRYLSKTTLRDYEDHGPAWWHAVHIAKTIRKPRPGGAAQGLALDCLLTEGNAAFCARYVVRPASVDARTKDGKQWLADHADREPIKEEDFAILMDAADAVRHLPVWGEIEKAAAQVTVRREAHALGLGLQSRPDWMDTGRGIVWDLKKTADLAGFGRQAINLGYHLQAAVAGWCLAGAGIALEKAFLVAVEWEAKARARVYEIPHPVLEAADRRMRQTAAQIAARIKSDDWSDIQAAPETLDVPEWMLRQMEAAP